MNREQWLNNLAKKLSPAFTAFGKPLPKSLRLSCGYPSKGGRSKTIGECFYPLASADAYTEIFVRPDQSASLDVAAIVLHELCHAALGPGFAHGKEFKKIAIASGLEGRMTATHAGPEAIRLLAPIIQKLGPYPHGALSLGNTGPHAKPQPHHPHKNLNCPDCGFHAKVRADQLSWGRLVCPVDGAMLLMKGE